MRKKPKQLMISVRMEANLPIGEAIVLCIERAGARRILKAILRKCLLNTIERSAMPSLLLATPNDEEMAHVGCALYYLEKNWDQAVKKGEELLSKKLKDATEEQERNERRRRCPGRR